MDHCGPQTEQEDICGWGKAEVVVVRFRLFWPKKPGVTGLKPFYSSHEAL